MKHVPLKNNNYDFNDDDDRNYAIAMRWCSETLHPQQQGMKNDGCTNATKCLHNLQKGIISPKKLIPTVGSTVHYGTWVTFVMHFWLFVLLRLCFFMFLKNFFTSKIDFLKFFY